MPGPARPPRAAFRRQAAPRLAAPTRPSAFQTFVAGAGPGRPPVVDGWRMGVASRTNRVPAVRARHGLSAGRTRAHALAQRGRAQAPAQRSLRARSPRAYRSRRRDAPQGRPTSPAGAGGGLLGGQGTQLPSGRAARGPVRRRKVAGDPVHLQVLEAASPQECGEVQPGPFLGQLDHLQGWTPAGSRRQRVGPGGRRGKGRAASGDRVAHPPGPTVRGTDVEPPPPSRLRKTGRPLPGPFCRGVEASRSGTETTSALQQSRARAGGAGVPAAKGGPRSMSPVVGGQGKARASARRAEGRPPPRPAGRTGGRAARRRPPGPVGPEGQLIGPSSVERRGTIISGGDIGRTHAEIPRPAGHGIARVTA